MRLIFFTWPGTLRIFSGMFRAILFSCALVLVCACARSQPGGKPGNASPGAAGSGVARPISDQVWPGAQPDGSMLLHNQWSIRPAGRQLELGDFPVNIAVHPSGRYAAILHSGYGPHQIAVVDLQTETVVSQTPVHETFYGISFSPDGRSVFCSGAGDEVVHEFGFNAGQLAAKRQIPLRDAKTRAVPAGIAVSASGREMYVANVWGHRATRVTLEPELAVEDILLGTNATALSTAPVVPSSDFDTAAIEKRAQATAYPSAPEDTFPYTCVIDEPHQRLYVSLWAQAGVAVVDLRTRKLAALWPAEDHACEMVLGRSGKFLFVANANRNTVSVIETQSGKTVEKIWVALSPDAPPGSTPHSLALTPDEKLLFVANADNNSVASFDVSRPSKTRPLGFIPTGWYPTSVRVTPDGKRLLITNGRGTTTHANPQGPQPGQKRPAGSITEYIGGLYRGTLSIVDLNKGAQFTQDMARYTADVYRCTPKASVGVGASATNSPVPVKPGITSPIKYCIYIIKENRTYDQVLGDMPEGKGDPKLCLFPERVTPNHHRLAREFVLLDNFYVNSEVSADGHEWSVGAYATDFVKKSWPLSYGHAKSGKFPYPAEGNFPIAAPASGYLWDIAKAAGISYRSYGEFIANGRTPETPGRAKVKSLEGHFDPLFRSFDMSYPDMKRAERFISEFKRLEAEGAMPNLQIVRLPNDHTAGVSAGQRTPIANVADNDAALGLIVEAITHSKYWAETAVFILEDDAQNGPDHIDAHRSPAFVISPYAKRGAVDSTMYSTTSMLRTMELILGMPPMTQHDAAARPMHNCFQPTPDLRPYRALPANVDVNERNSPVAWGSQYKMNLAVEDAADDLLLNEVIWRSVRGANSPMPAPVRAAFVMPHSKDVDDD